MSNPDDKNRYAQRSGSGSNQPRRHERKEQDPDWRSRQGGDQTRGAEDVARRDADQDPVRA